MSNFLLIPEPQKFAIICSNGWYFPCFSPHHYLSKFLTATLHSAHLNITLVQNFISKPMNSSSLQNRVQKSKRQSSTERTGDAVMHRLFCLTPVQKLCKPAAAASTWRRHVSWGSRTQMSIFHVWGSTESCSVSGARSELFFCAYALHTHPGRQVETTDRRRWSCLKAFVMW